MIGFEPLPVSPRSETHRWASPEPVWAEVTRSGDVDAWVEHLDRVELADRFSFLAAVGALRQRGRQVSVAQWLNSLGPVPEHELHPLIRGRDPIEHRLALATFGRWEDRVRTVLRDVDSDAIPKEGVLQYFADDLAVCILVAYRRPGSTATLDALLAFPDPEAFFEPVQALRHAKSDRQLALLRRALFSRHKIVLHRNTLVHIDREAAPEVFGPSIDTLFLNDWLSMTRYLPQRTLEHAAYFTDPMSREASDASLSSGTRFLEIGSGNGLLTATYARNEARIASFAALDASLAAVTATYVNSANQRGLPGGRIGDRGRYVVARYSAEAVPHGNDLVVCNPPYVPVVPGEIRLPSHHPLTEATVGTELLSAVVADAPALVGEQGELVMVASELAEPELLSAVPRGYAVTKAAQRRVPFDVGPMSSQPVHLAWLRDARGLVEERRGQQYSHVIAIYVVHSTQREAMTDEALDVSVPTSADGPRQ